MNNNAIEFLTLNVKAFENFYLRYVKGFLSTFNVELKTQKLYGKTKLYFDRLYRLLK